MEAKAPPKRNKVSYVLRTIDAERVGHCFGVNSLCSDSNRRLWSAGRDGSIREWDLTEERVVFLMILIAQAFST